MLKCVVLIVAVVVVAGNHNQVSHLVNIDQGPVRGYKYDGNIFAFYGIPYATAPVGVHKFKAPLPPPQWTTPFEATNKNIVCPQTKYFFNIDGYEQEDCLIANVYVPDTDEINLPVVVQVHGGGYRMGYGNLLTLNQLIEKKEMIVVNFNYRLGVHGFLCLGTEDVPGNAGMKDQVALLRWVKRNIANFGGNPDDVTIIGFSAGASAVDLLLLSPITKGLFSKVVPESGASLSTFSVQSDPTETAWNYAKRLNFTNEENDIYALEKFYKTMSLETMFSVDVMNETDSISVFSPCLERDVGEERFLDDAPLNILRKGRHQKLPMLFGFAEMEGLIRIPVFGSWKEQMNEKFSDFLPSDLKFSSDEEKEMVALEIKKFYFGNKPVSEETILRYIDYFTDIVFAYGTLRSAKLQIESGNNEIYLYEYSFVDDNTPFVPHTQVRGANHCAQSMAIGDGILQLQGPANDTKDLKQMKEVLRELWINFIVTGKPVPENSILPSWPSAKKHGDPHMSIDKTMKLRGPFLQQRMLFWDTIYEKYYRMPIPPATPMARKIELKPVPENSTLPSWPSAKTHGDPHMSIDTTMKLRGPFLQQRMLFWDSINEKYYRMPVPPATPVARKSEL